MNQGITERQIIVEDLLITYYTAGASSLQKCVVFLHGWRSNSTLWFDIFPPLIEAGYSIFALDFPGFGKSQSPKKALFLSDYVATVATFMQKLEIQQPVIIGHSHGGRVAIKMAVQDPKLMQKLVLVDSGGIKRETTDKNIKKNFAKVLKPLFSPSFMKPFKNRIYKAMGAEDYVATPQLKQTFLNIINEDLTTLLPKITNQTLILWGQNDQDTPLQDAWLMEKEISNAQLILLPEAAHYSFLDSPEEFKKHLMNFLQK